MHGLRYREIPSIRQEFVNYLPKVVKVFHILALFRHSLMCAVRTLGGLSTLQRAAALVGRKARIDLVAENGG